MRLRDMANAVKGNGTTKVILAVVAIITLAIAVGNIIYRQGLHEGEMRSVCTVVNELKEKQEKQIARDEAQDAMMAEMQRKQAFQEGLFSAKLDSVEKALVRIETYLLQWEATDAESN